MLFIRRQSNVSFMCQIDCTYKELSRGSRPVAQLVEHRSPKPRVAGSSPVGPASIILKEHRFVEIFVVG